MQSHGHVHSARRPCPMAQAHQPCCQFFSRQTRPFSILLTRPNLFLTTLVTYSTPTVLRSVHNCAPTPAASQPTAYPPCPTVFSTFVSPSSPFFVSSSYPPHLESLRVHRQDPVLFDLDSSSSSTSTLRLGPVQATLPPTSSCRHQVVYIDLGLSSIRILVTTQLSSTPFSLST